MVFFLRPFLWSILAFLICGNCLQILQNVLQQMGNRITILGSIKHPTPIGWRKTYSCCILTPMPWARLHPTISPSLKKKRIICYSFILSKLVYHFTMVTLHKHHYTNNPTTKHTFIIAHVAILMPREGICTARCTCFIQKIRESEHAKFLYCTRGFVNHKMK